MLLDTNPGYRTPLIIDDSETGRESPTPTQNRIIFLGTVWPVKAFNTYQRIYGLTYAKFSHYALYRGTNTECDSVIAISFQEPIWEGLNKILGEFEVVDYKTTLQFIAKYPNIAPLLKHVRRAIRRYFGNADVSLGPETAPETGNQQLWVNIHTELPVSEAMKILENFDDDHFLKIWKKSNRKLCLDLLFI